jgi:hypothetical protein
MDRYVAPLYMVEEIGLNIVIGVKFVLTIFCGHISALCQAAGFVYFRTPPTLPPLIFHKMTLFCTYCSTKSTNPTKEI